MSRARSSHPSLSVCGETPGMPGPLSEEIETKDSAFGACGISADEGAQDGHAASGTETSQGAKKSSRLLGRGW
jgi:hypothetical protein